MAKKYLDELPDLMVKIHPKKIKNMDDYLSMDNNSKVDDEIEFDVENSRELEEIPITFEIEGKSSVPEPDPVKPKKKTKRVRWKNFQNSDSE